MGSLRICGYIILENRLRNNFATREQTYRQTDTHTDIHKGNNNEIKFAKDITAVKKYVLEDCFDAIRCFFYLKLEKQIKNATLALCAHNLFSISF